MRRIAVNFLLFQAGWFACVLSGAAARPYLAVLVAVAVATWHVARAPHRVDELVMLSTVTALGAMFDSLLAASGWLLYASPVPSPALAPVWIVALWVCFATTLNVSLRWLRSNPFFAAVFGLIGGPLAYLAGAALGGIVFVRRPEALMALATGWAVITPVVLAIAARFDGFRDPGNGSPAREHV